MGYIHISDETEQQIKEAATKNGINTGEEIERGYNGYINCEKRLKEQKEYYLSRENTIYNWIENTTERVFKVRLKADEAEIFNDKNNLK